MGDTVGRMTDDGQDEHDDLWGDPDDDSDDAFLELRRARAYLTRLMGDDDAAVASRAQLRRRCPRPSGLRRVEVFDFDHAVFRELFETREMTQFLAYLRYSLSDHRPLWAEFALAT
jgi:hypothetical protein